MENEEDLKKSGTRKKGSVILTTCLFILPLTIIWNQYDYRRERRKSGKKWGKEMRTQKALQIARREWENIRSSLEMCGNIGEFDSKNYINGRTAILSEDSFLFRNLIEMENKLPTYGYFTQEASYVFTTLASKAGERLGLTDKLAQTFGRGYSWIRTGWFDSVGIEKQHLIKQVIFFKLFFPLGKDFISWDFNSPMVKKKLSIVFYKFITWQGNPSSYIQDVRDYREQLEPLWYGLSLTLDSSIEFSE